MKKAITAGWTVAVVAVTLVGVGARPAVAAPTTYNTPGEVVFFNIPAGVTQMTVDVYGAQGGAATGPYAGVGGVGGKGGRSQGTFAVVEGEQWAVGVGQQGGLPDGDGGDGGTTDGGTNGGNGGSSSCCPGDETTDRDGGGGGAGSFVVRVLPGPLPDYTNLVMAGGGGGGAAGGDGGTGGGGNNNGGSGSVPTGTPNGTAATGGTQTGPGLGGSAAGTGSTDDNGQDGVDVDGGDDGGDGTFSAGGGGGGGLYGGGGGGTGFYGGSGAGGSGTLAGVTGGSGQTGVHLGDGKVVVTFVTGAAEQRIKLTSPNGGESWARGTTHTIQWDYVNATGESVKISLTQNNQFVRVIVASRPIGNSGHGAFNWTIPNDLPPGGNYKVRISIKNSSPKDFDSSNGTFSFT